MNRGQAQLAMKLGVRVQHVKNVIIWGNHSNTQVPDVEQALVYNDGAYQPASGLLEEKWVREDFTNSVQQRGKAIIDARGLSSAMSAANASKDCLRDWVRGTPDGEFVSMAVYSDGSYGVAKDLFYSFPCVCRNGRYRIVQGLHVSDHVKELMKVSEQELLEEKKEAGLK